MNTPVLAATVAAAVLAAPAAAQAHVTLNPREVTAGAFTVMTVRVPNERDDKGTVKVDVRFPTASTPSPTRRSRAGRPRSRARSSTSPSSARA